jgi:hypothetical protein
MFMSVLMQTHKTPLNYVLIGESRNQQNEVEMAISPSVTSAESECCQFTSRQNLRWRLYIAEACCNCVCPPAADEVKAPSKKATEP